MKKHLILFKKLLTKNKNVYIKKDKENEPNVYTESKNKENNKKIINIASSLGLEFTMHNLQKVSPKQTINRYNIDENNMIFFYPVNDGMPTCSFEFYKYGKLIIHNRNTYSEITNLDEIILQIIRIFNKSLDDGIVLDPYYFMLKLDDEIKEKYQGKATLVITEKVVRNQVLNEKNYNVAVKYYINQFLDHFIGWNFGVSVNRNEILKNELEALNEKVINKGIREYAGPGFEVYGLDKVAQNGLQHYYLPTDKKALLIKKKI